MGAIFAVVAEGVEETPNREVKSVDSNSTRVGVCGAGVGLRVGGEAVGFWDVLRLTDPEALNFVGCLERRSPVGSCSRREVLVIVSGLIAVSSDAFTGVWTSLRF